MESYIATMEPLWIAYKSATFNWQQQQALANLRAEFGCELLTKALPLTGSNNILDLRLYTVELWIAYKSATFNWQQQQMDMMVMT